MTAFDITIHVDLTNGEIFCDPPYLPDDTIRTVAHAAATAASEAVTCVLAALTETPYTPTDGGLTYAVLSCGAAEHIARVANDAMHNPGANPLIDEAVANAIRLKMKSPLGGLVGEIVSGILDHLLAADRPETPDTTPEQANRERALFLPHPDGK